MKKKIKINKSKLLLNTATLASIIYFIYILIDMFKSILQVMTLKDFIML